MKWKARETCQRQFVHLPYYVPRKWHVRGSESRVKDFVYVGTPLSNRYEVLRGLLKSQKYLLTAAAHQANFRKPVSERQLRLLYAHSKFVISLPGSTPESRRIYDALASGTPFVYFQTIFPPFNSTFSGVGFPARFADLYYGNLSSVDVISNTLQTYQPFLRYFALEREKFLWETNAFRRHFLDNIDRKLRSMMDCHMQ